VVASTLLLGVVGIVLALLPNGSGLFPALVLFIPAALITSTCLRMRVKRDDDVITICNGLRTRRVRCSAIDGIKDRPGPNLGITSLAWYWSWRRRIWWLVLSDGSEVRVGVFTELQSEGEWHPVGNISAGQWWAAFLHTSPAE
jgi:hypothetical protein